MKELVFKMKKGGLDTIVAYIVVILPLLYVLIYMVATIYHFSVQTYMGQVVKEATVMVSTYGDITPRHEDYIYGKLKSVLRLGDDKDGLIINYYVKKFNEGTGIVGAINTEPYDLSDVSGKLDKADIIGIQVISEKNSILHSVTSFSAFGVGENGTKYEGAENPNKSLKYTAYREEIIRNEREYNP